MPFLKGEVKESPRKEFLYWSDDGDLMAIRHGDWKVTFMEQYHQGQAIWDHEYTRLRLPNIYNLLRRPVRAWDLFFLVSRLEGTPYLSDLPCNGRARSLAQHVQRVSHPPEAREIQRRRGDPEAVRVGERRHLRAGSF